MGTKGLESKSRVGASGAGSQLKAIERVVLLACGDYDRRVDRRAEALGPSLEWEGPRAR